MGIILNWSSSYPTNVDDTVTNFPTVTDGVHEVMASHVNELAKAVVQLETIIGGFRAAPVEDPFINLSSGYILRWNGVANKWVGTPDTSVHLDTSGEFTTVTLKSTPDSTDTILIEDGATTDKKYVTVGSLLSGSSSDLQGAYDAGASVVLTPATPISITTSGAGEDGITVSDGTDTVTLRGNGVLVPNGNSFAPSVRAASDETTGLYWETGAMGVAIGGSEALRLQRSGVASFGVEVLSDVLLDAGGQSGSAEYVGMRVNVDVTGRFSSGQGYLLELASDAVGVFQVTETGAALASDGFSAAPAYAFRTDPGSGVYYGFPTSVGVVAGGATSDPAILAVRQAVSSTGDEVLFDLTGSVNKATSGNYTGIKLDVTETAAPGTDNRLLDLQVGGTSLMHVTSTGTLRVPDGSATDPSIGIASATGTGLTKGGANELTLVAAGQGVLDVRSGGIAALAGKYIQANSGGGLGAAAPALKFGDDSGFYYVAAGDIGYSVAGVAKYRIDATAIFPENDIDVALGKAANRFTTVYSQTLNTGDVNLKSLHDDGFWTINEDARGVYLHDRRTGKSYKLMMEEAPDAPTPLPLEG